MSICLATIPYTCLQKKRCLICFHTSAVVKQKSRFPRAIASAGCIEREAGREKPSLLRKVPIGQRLSQAQARLSVEHLLSAALDRLALAHMAQPSLLRETRAFKQFQRVVMLRRDKYARRVHEWQRQGVHEQTFGVFHGACDPWTQHTRLREQVATHVATHITRHQHPLRITRAVRGQHCPPLCSKRRRVE